MKEVTMKRILALLMSLAVVMCFSASVFAETTLEKINRTGVLTIGTRTGVLTIGTRTGVQGFAFVNN
jgi:ABC-type amino acid transport substrate-binding protein